MISHAVQHLLSPNWKHDSQAKRLVYLQFIAVLAGGASATSRTNAQLASRAPAPARLRTATTPADKIEHAKHISQVGEMGGHAANVTPTHVHHSCSHMCYCRSPLTSSQASCLYSDMQYMQACSTGAAVTEESLKALAPADFISKALDTAFHRKRNLGVCVCV
jgi:hypothetical protein